MTRKDANRRLATALREQEKARKEVRELNARVVEDTSAPPQRYYPSGHAMPSGERRLSASDRERIQKLIDRAQKASDRLASATADVVNLRRLIGAEPTGSHHAKKKTPRQLDADIAQSLTTSGEPQLAELFADPEARKTFAREMRLELQKKQLVQETKAAFEARPFTVKHMELMTVLDDDSRPVERKVRSLVGNFKTEADARARADQLGGWVETRDGRVVYGNRPSDHATLRGAKKKPKSSRSYATRVAYRIKLTPSELRAIEFARGRYAWPDMLSSHAADDGTVAFTESEMWQWTDDVDSDDAPFPLAAPAFVAKLQRFYDERI